MFNIRSFLCLAAIVALFSGKLWRLAKWYVFSSTRRLVDSFKFMKSFVCNFVVANCQIGINGQGGIFEPACCGDFVASISNGCQIQSCYNIAVPSLWCPDEVFGMCICDPASGKVLDECTDECVLPGDCSSVAQLEVCKQNNPIDFHQSRCKINN